jgi:hypothetical protein
MLIETSLGVLLPPLQKQLKRKARHRETRAYKACAEAGNIRRRTAAGF